MWYLRRLGNVSGVSTFAPVKKEWITTAIGVGASLASSFFGGMEASKAAKRAESRQRGREAEEAAWYGRKYNEQYVDTAAGQNLVRRAKEFAEDNTRRAAGAQAVAGGTDAATQMAKDAGNKMMGDTIANIAATDAERRAQADLLHRQAQESFAQQDINREMGRAQNITQAAQGASNAIMQGANAFEKDTNLTGGSNR